MQPNVRKLFLDEYHTHPIVIDGKCFAAITRLVHLARVCQVCGLPYTVESVVRLRVAENICLSCYLKTQRDAYTFIGKHDAEEGSEHTTYLYLDVNGMVHYSTTASDDGPRENVEMTLRYYGFPLPHFYTENGQEKELYGGEWHIRGDVRTQSVVVIEFIKRIDDHRHIPFLSTKHGDVLLLEKRRGNTRRLYQQAKRQYELTTEKNQWFESDILRLVSELASAEYDRAQA